jgi:hypothetical protein
VRGLFVILACARFYAKIKDNKKSEFSGGRRNAV